MTPADRSALEVLLLGHLARTPDPVLLADLVALASPHNEAETVAALDRLRRAGSVEDGGPYRTYLATPAGRQGAANALTASLRDLAPDAVAVARADARESSTRAIVASMHALLDPEEVARRRQENLTYLTAALAGAAGYARNGQRKAAARHTREAARLTRLLNRGTEPTESRA